MDLILQIVEQLFKFTAHPSSLVSRFNLRINRETTIIQADPLHPGIVPLLAAGT